MSPRSPRVPTLATLREDTRHEQFFFNAATRARLVGLAERFTDPLLVCLPSVAVALAEQGRPHRLLDRDARFHGLPRAEDFDLQHPHFLTGQHGALLIDPPFANITLATLADTIGLLVSGALARTAHPALGICYISDREDALLSAFSEYDLAPVGAPLGYRSVAAHTQARIRLYLSRGARET